MLCASSARRPCEGASAEKVEMQMPDRLSSIRTCIRHEAEPAVSDTELSCNLRHNGGQNMRCQLPILFRKVQHTRKMLLRNDENMLRRLRIEVAERKHLIVLIDLCRGNLSLCNPAKDTIRYFTRFLSICFVLD